MAALVESSEQDWLSADAELIAANTKQFEKFPKAPPLPKYLFHQPAKARSSPLSGFKFQPLDLLLLQ